MGHFLCGVKAAKRFVNVHLHRNISYLKKINKLLTFHLPLEEFLRTTMATFNPFSKLSSFDI